MKKAAPKLVRIFVQCMSALALSLMFLFGPSTGAKADEADARKILKSMSDYMAAQTSISFGFDATLEIVTTDEQKLALASSGNLYTQIEVPGTIDHLIDELKDIKGIDDLPDHFKKGDAK